MREPTFFDVGTLPKLDASEKTVYFIEELLAGDVFPRLINRKTKQRNMSMFFPVQQRAKLEEKGK